MGGRMAFRCIMSCFRIPWSACSSVASTHNISMSLERSFMSLSISRNVSAHQFLRGRQLPLYGASTSLSATSQTQLKKKRTSAERSAIKAEKRRSRNRARKSAIKSSMRRVFAALDELKTRADAKAEDILPVEELISKAHKAIDKAVSAGTIHRNTGARRKSRLARRKKSVEIHHGWFVPAAV